MKINNYYKKLIKYAIYGFALFVSFLILKELAVLCKYILIGWQYFDPAENENLVLTWFYKKNLFIKGDELINYGVFPIYPDFYHKLSALLPLNPTISGRIISILATIVTQSVLTVWIYRRIESFSSSILFALLSYGVLLTYPYFLIQRVDGLFISLGIISLLILWWNFNFNKNMNKQLLEIPAWRFILSGCFLSLSFLTKQTATIFIALYYIPLIIQMFSKDRFHIFKKYSLSIGSFVLVILSYTIIFGTSWIFYYYSGLKMFSSTFNLVSVWNHYNSVINQWYQVLGIICILILIRSFVYIKNEWRIFIFLCFAIISFVTIKMWGNSAAFYNNFIFISLFSIFFIVFVISYISEVERLSIILLLSAIAYVGFLNNSQNLFSIKNYYNWNCNNTSEIVLYIKNNNGNYLSSRSDNYLINNECSVYYESSVLTTLLLNIDSYNLSKIPYYNQILGNKEKIRKIIQDKKFKGIILGIDKTAFSSIFPEINIYYKKQSEEIVNNGVLTYNLILMVPK